MTKKTLSIYDLQIGDIVIGEEYYLDENTDEEVYNDHPFKIEGVSESDSIYIDGEECRYEGNWMDKCQCETVGDIYPMPITEEFLTLNGYEDCGTYLVNDWSEGNILKEGHKSNYIQLMKWSMDGDLKVFQLGVILNNLPAINTEVRYVHQLQHALRAIGLADKAKFKVR